MKLLTQSFDVVEFAAGIPVSSSLKVGELITKLLPYIFGAAGIILVLNIIVSGYQMMTSTGEPKIMQAAKAKVTTSIIGIMVIFISFWVVAIIGSFFGLDIFKQIFGLIIGTKEGVDLVPLPPVI